MSIRPAALVVPGLAALALLPACVVQLGCSVSHSRPRIEGSGTLLREAREVPAFRRLHVSGGYDVLVRGGEPCSVAVSGDDNLVPLVRTWVDGDTLRVDLEGVSISTRQPLAIEVSAPELESLEFSGSVDLDASGLEGERLAIEVSGSASGAVQGRVASLIVDVSGSANLDLSELEAREVDLDVSGSGHVRVFAIDRLSVDVSGSAEVTYRGEPTTEVDLSGSALIRSE